MNIELRRGSKGLIATWQSPDGPFNLIWLTDLEPEDYENEPELMDLLKEHILTAYRQAPA